MENLKEVVQQNNIQRFVNFFFAAVYGARENDLKRVCTDLMEKILGKGQALTIKREALTALFKDPRWIVAERTLLQHAVIEGDFKAELIPANFGMEIITEAD